MPVLAFVVGFVGLYALVAAIRAIVRGIAWMLGYGWGLLDAGLKGRPGRALLAFGGLIGVMLCVQRF